MLTGIRCTHSLFATFYVYLWVICSLLPLTWLILLGHFCLHSFEHRLNLLHILTLGMLQSIMLVSSYCVEENKMHFRAHIPDGLSCLLLYSCRKCVGYVCTMFFSIWCEFPSLSMCCRVKCIYFFLLMYDTNSAVSASHSCFLSLQLQSHSPLQYNFIILAL